MILKKVSSITAMLCLFIVANAQIKTVYPEGLKVGDKAPMFSAKNQNGKEME